MSRVERSPRVYVMMPRSRHRLAVALKKYGFLTRLRLVRPFRLLTRVTTSLLICGFVGVVGATANSSASASPTTHATSSDTFHPISVDFSSSRQGWALGTLGCVAPTRCLALRSTSDAGRSWTDVALPQALLDAANRFVTGRPAIMYSDPPSGTPGELYVRFADSSDGWIYGALPVTTTMGDSPAIVFHSTLWSTHDGGRRWHQQSQAWVSPQVSVLDLETTAHTVYELALNTTGGVRIEDAPVARDAWHVSYQSNNGMPAGGTQVQGAMLLNGNHGWMLEGNDRGVIVSAELNAAGTWRTWSAPCASLGRSLSAMAAYDPNHLVTACVMGGFAYPLPPSAPRGATVGSTWLYVSRNGGRTFRAGPELGAYDTFLGAPIAAPEPNIIILSRNNPNRPQLLRSFDGGHSWRVVFNGSVTDLTFISTSRGYAIIQRTPTTTQLLTTGNGGETWAPVSIT